MRAQPEAVVTIAPYKPVAEFIKLANQVGMASLFVAISFVGSDSLAAELGSQGSGVIVSQVVPFPADTSLPVVASYRKALSALDATARPGYVSLEGYIVGRLAIEALRRNIGQPTRESLLDSIVMAPIDLDGVTLSYGPSNNQGSNQVFFTALQRDGTFLPVTRLGKVVAQ